MDDVSIALLRQAHAVTPIRGCPGRFHLRGADRSSPGHLTGGLAVVERHRSPQAADPVLIVRLRDGGLISYEKPDGTFVHTLGDPDGFARKLAQLGIPLDAAG
jgi:hypothetical protein